MEYLSLQEGNLANVSWQETQISVDMLYNSWSGDSSAFKVVYYNFFLLELGTWSSLAR